MLFGTTEFADTSNAFFANVSQGGGAGTTGESWREYCLKLGKVEWVQPTEDVRNIIRCEDGN